MKRNQLNDKIRQAVKAIARAEMAGVRGEPMIALKRKLRLLKEAHSFAA